MSHDPSCVAEVCHDYGFFDHPLDGNGMAQVSQFEVCVILLLFALVAAVFVHWVRKSFW